MNSDELRVSAKNQAKTLIKSNFATCLAATLIYFVPATVFQLILYYGVEFTSFFNNVFMVLIMFAAIIISPLVTYLIFTPLSFGSVKVFYTISRGEKPQISDVFYYFQTSDRIKWCYTVIWKFFIKSVWIMIKYLGIPFVVLMVSVFIVSSPYTSVSSTRISFFLIIISWLAIAFLSIFVSIKQIAIELATYVCVITDTNNIKETMNENIAIYKDKKMNLFVFSLSFTGWALLAAALSTISLGLSFALLSIYQAFSTVLYAKYHHDLYCSKKPDLLEKEGL